MVARNLGHFAGAVIVAAMACRMAGAAEGDRGERSPIRLVADASGARLYVAQVTSAEVAVVDVAAQQVRQALTTSGPPTGLALSPDGRKLYVTCAGPEGAIDVFDVQAVRKVATLRGGHTPMSPVLSPDAKVLYVCNRFSNSVSLLEMERSAEQALSSELPVVREPVAAALTPDGKWLLVANHLPAGRSDGDRVAAVVSVIDTAARTVAHNIELPNGSTALRGICISPDGKQAYVTHLLARYQLPTTQLERGWMSTNALSIIDVAESKLLNTVLLDEPERGAANPWGVACSADGRWLCVAHAGTHEISVIGRAALLERLAKVAAGERVSEVSAAPEDVPNDLTFLQGIRRRVKLAGIGPRDVAIAGTKVYAAEYFTDSVGVVELGDRGIEGSRDRGSAESTNEGSGGKVVPGPAPSGSAGAIALAVQAVSLPLGPKAEPGAARRGQMLFNDATICFQHWQSCASCHPDGRADGLNWDLLNDGIGNPKNTKSLLKAHETPPAMAHGIRASAEVAVRAGIKHILLAVRPEEEAEAIDAYLRALTPVASPYLRNGQLGAAAQRGREVFASAGCAKCHPAPLYTDGRTYDVGTDPGVPAGEDVRPAGDARTTRGFDTPTLIEVWRTAPYLHDGRAVTMEEVLKRCNADGKHGQTAKLSAADLAALTEFVLSQ